MFHLIKLFSLFPDHLHNNDKNDQYHDVSIDAFVILIGLLKLDLMICWLFVTLFIDSREVCFAWLYHVLCNGSHIFLTISIDLSLWIDFFSFLCWQRWKKVFLNWLLLNRKQQTNNSLSPNLGINSYSLSKIFSKWLIWTVINLDLCWDHIWKVVSQWHGFSFVCHF